ncbi:acetyl xylan esterase [Pedobacter sp. HMF7647]|uniref:Acetyl xylan esterase n=1 Tax=Hufsiella arboris TaxID=2695275 RepID=A0A7K1YA24_9SPHI|nr:acetyl xylan esterase [Hufsiella arboris]
MSRLVIISVCLLLTLPTITRAKQNVINFYRADNPLITYTGRVDFTDKMKPRFWAPGVYVQFSIEGQRCDVLLNDEVLYGTKHSYLEIAVDDKKAYRIQLKEKENIFTIPNLSSGKHFITVCKNTESSIGYLEFLGVKAEKLLKSPPGPIRRIEFIGNSITCGTGSDQSEIPCGKGVWEDQHNAYMSYGPTTARALNAQWMLTSYSGIGLTHSCCNIKTTMPQLFDKVIFYKDSLQWDFKRYQPDVLTICLGQNDGIQDSAMFCNAYVSFIKQVRAQYPATSVVCITSPMADQKLRSFMENMIAGITKSVHASGDQNVSSYFFKKRYHNGCDDHPDLAEHAMIANELSAYIKKLKQW